MDISVIKAEQTNAKNGLVIGNGKHIMKEFMNLRCPYCRQWFNESKALLADADVMRVIKLFDKEKPSLQRGNVMHRFVDTTNESTILASIQKIFDTQEEWGDLELDEVATFAKEKLGLSENNHSTYSQLIVDEANAANIKFVPTIIVEEHIFDESISEDELKEILK